MSDKNEKQISAYQFICQCLETTPGTPYAFQDALHAGKDDVAYTLFRNDMPGDMQDKFSKVCCDLLVEAVSRQIVTEELSNALSMIPQFTYAKAFLRRIRSYSDEVIIDRDQLYRFALMLARDCAVINEVKLGIYILSQFPNDIVKSVFRTLGLHNSMEQMLYNEYGIQVQSLQQIPAGWSASAWKVHSECGDYFLKVYDKHKPSTRNWIARIDSYMPVVLWLHENTKLQKKMTAPILTRDRTYKKEDSSFLYMVFPFIEGSTICDEKLKPEQIREVAQIISELHFHGAEIPASTNSLIETFDVSFCTTLSNRLGNIHASASLQEVLKPYMTLLAQATESLQSMGLLLQNSKMRYVMCHTDLHGWNLIQSKNLILIDWEGLKLAPVEADLFSFTGTFFFDYAWEDFMSIYQTTHKDYQINVEAMRFYRLRRRLEDIHEFVESILFDKLTQDDMNQSLRYLKQECELLHVMC